LNTLVDLLEGTLHVLESDIFGNPVDAPSQSASQPAALMPVETAVGTIEGQRDVIHQRIMELRERLGRI
jgi:hypothetical protein